VTKFKLRSDNQRVRRFNQIIKYGDTIAGLDDFGRVWIFVPMVDDFDLGAEGWYQLTDKEIEPE